MVTAAALAMTPQVRCLVLAVYDVEVRSGSELVGGLYGVSLGAAFFGESMFHRRTDCSKIAMANLLFRLEAGNYRLLDTQFVTEHLKTFGGIEIPREIYEMQLAEALKHQGDYYAIDVASPSA